MSEPGRSAKFAVTLRFHGDLTFFLSRRHAGGEVVRRLGEKTAVKDVVESCGVPHPEVDLILCDGVPGGFGFHLVKDAVVDVYPVSAPQDFHPTERLQRRHLTRFVADGHLGKLARDLRLLGFDTAYGINPEDAALVRIAVEEDRALLTRDRRLLMHSVIRDGYTPRSHIPEEQTVEVIRRFGLAADIRPYTRCLRCNGLLERVRKEAIIAQLEPLTRIHYEEFRRCVECAHVYWSGSHFAKLDARIQRLTGRLRTDEAARKGRSA